MIFSLKRIQIVFAAAFFLAASVSTSLGTTYDVRGNWSISPVSAPCGDLSITGSSCSGWHPKISLDCRDHQLDLAAGFFYPTLVKSGTTCFDIDLLPRDARLTGHLCYILFAPWGELSSIWVKFGSFEKADTSTNRVDGSASFNIPLEGSIPVEIGLTKALFSLGAHSANSGNYCYEGVFQAVTAAPFEVQPCPAGGGMLAFPASDITLDLAPNPGGSLSAMMATGDPPVGFSHSNFKLDRYWEVNQTMAEALTAGVSIAYDPNELPAGIYPADLVLAGYDESIGEWFSLNPAQAAEKDNTVSAAEVEGLSYFVITTLSPVTVESSKWGSVKARYR